MGSEFRTQRVSASTLIDLLQQRAAEQPGQTAYTFLRDDSSPAAWTYADLERRTRAVAQWLSERAEPGDRALLLYPQGLEFLAGFFGCLYAGLIAAPLPLPGARQALERLGLVVEDTGAKLLLTTAAIAAAPETRALLPAGVGIQATPEIETGRAEVWRRPDRVTEPAYLQYTSGSTSAPRGVMVTHRNVLHNLANIDAGFRHTSESVIVSWLPHFHDMGLIYGLLAPLYLGRPCYFMAPASFIRRPRLWLETISEYRGTHSGGPNFAYDLCVRRIPEADREGLDLGSWEVAFNGAEPVHAETLDRFARAFASCGFRRSTLYPAYGLAEASLKVSGGIKGNGPALFAARASSLARNEVAEAAADSGDVRVLVGCGAPGLETRVAIVDPETLLELPPDRVGEIWVKGPGVAVGYWNRPEETRTTFHARIADTGEGPFLRTGDLGFLRDGELYVVGRLKDLIIVRGMNHHPADLELTARKAHPDVGASIAAAFSVESQGREGVVLVMEAPRRMSGPAEAVAQAVRQRIAEEHELRVAILVLVRKGSIPRTSSGKIQRRLCRDLYFAGRLPVLYESRLEDAGPAAEALPINRETVLAAGGTQRRRLVEEHLTDLLARLLHVRPGNITPGRALTEFGLDSLRAVEIQNAVEKSFGVAVEVVDLLNGLTLDELAGRILSGLETAAAVAERIPALGRNEHPLSFEQERLWLLDRIVPGNSAYHLPLALRLQGVLDPDAFRRAVAAVARRQESLRTVFGMREGIPVAVVRELPVEQIPVQFEDLTGLTEADRFDEACERAVRAAREAFDLERGPLFRWRIYRLGENDYLALIVTHHIISDLWSLRLFLEEVFEAYADLRAGEEVRLPALPVQYGDFAVWQRERLQGERLHRLQEFWRRKLSHAPVLTLPADRPRPEKPTYRASSEAVAFPSELTSALRNFCRREKTTLFTVLLAAFKALAARISGQEDLVVGTTNASRNRPELERLIGFFAAPLATRTDVTGDPAFRELVRRVRSGLLEVYEHQELPFAKVVEAAHPDRQAVYTPLFHIMFSLVQPLVTEIDRPDFTVEPVDLPVTATDFDLFLNIFDEPKSLRALAVYNRDLYDAPTIRRLITAYLELLQAAVENPETRLSRLPVIPELRRVGKEPPPAEPAVVVSATFTAEPLEEILRFWMGELGFDYQVRFAPYNQVFQELLDPSSATRSNTRGINAVLVRLQDWAGGDSRAAEIEHNAEEFLRALHTAAGAGASYLVCLCPASPEFLAVEANRRLVDQIEERIAAAFTGAGRVHVVKSAEILSLYPVADYHDPHGERLGHVPYTPEFYAALGTMIARKVHAVRTRPFKVIALDCDQTLWRGVCGEDGPEGVVIDGPRRALQQFMKQQREAGMLLTLVSKNSEEDVWAVFDSHPEMPLKREDFVAWRINWEPKSENLEQLAAELDLGLDTFVFIDDNPAECAAVEAALPQVLTLNLPREPERIPVFLRHVWALDHLAATEEDKKRSQMYGQALERRRLQQQVSTLAEFLAALQLRVEIEPVRPKHLPRVAQLTQRTNQFNCTTIRRDEAEVAEFLKEGEGFVAHVSDRFGSYGLVGVALFSARDGVLDVDTFLLSCRALGRGVEHRMLARLGEIALERGFRTVRLNYRRTPKNRPARKFLDSVAQPERGDGETAVYVLPAAAAAAVSYDPEQAPAEPQPTSSGTPPAGEEPGRSIDYARIAGELHDPAEILRRVRSELRSDAVSTVPYEPPRTPLERRLAEIWSEMLNVPKVGINDNFFDLGGHSLLAVQLLSRVREEFQADLPLDVVFTGNFSVAELAKAIELYEIEQADKEEYEKLLEELEGLSDEEVRALLEQEGEETDAK